MSDSRRANGTGVLEAGYDPTVVGLTFHTGDPEEPLAGFGERERMPIPEVGEVVRFGDDQLGAEARSVGPGRPERGYRVVDREFEYRRVDYDGFAGEGRRRLVVFVGVEVEPIREERGQNT